MSMFPLIKFLLLPTAMAAGVDDIGANSPGVGSMWSYIRETFPLSGADTSLPTIIAARIVSLVTSVVGIAAVIAIVYAGILVASAGGDDGKFSQAKTTIMYALVGVAIVMLGQAVLLYMCGTIFPIIFGGGAQCQTT
jgi:hypothetical protein